MGTFAWVSVFWFGVVFVLHVFVCVGVCPFWFGVVVLWLRVCCVPSRGCGRLLVIVFAMRDWFCLCACVIVVVCVPNRGCVLSLAFCLFVARRVVFAALYFCF